jgi:hypothetical protein
MLTEWMKPIQDFPGYWITHDGRVWSEPKGNHNGRWLKLQKLMCKDGSYYLHVGLTKNWKRYSRQIHRLVAEAYIPNPDKKPQVNHIDTNKLNNHYKNLEWNTNGENQKHAYDNGLRESVRIVSIKAMSKANSKRVLCIETGEVFPSATAVSKHIGLCKAAVAISIHQNCRAGGYTWKYIEQENALVESN